MENNHVPPPDHRNSGSTRSELLASFRLPLVQYLLLYLVVMCVHVPTFWFTYVWDDLAFIVENESLREIKYLPRYFTDPNTFMHDPGDQLLNAYRPLRNVYYLFTFKIHQLHPAGWHFQHVLLHSLVASMLLAFFHRLYRYAMAWPADKLLPLHVQLAAWFAVLAWGVHPANTEVTAWLKSADDLLSCIMTLGALMLLFPLGKAVTYTRAITAAVVFALAFLAKESIAPIPAIYPLLVLILAPDRWAAIRHKPHWAATALLFAALGVYIVIRKVMLGKLEQVGYLAGSFSNMMATMTTAAVRYLQLVAWPFWPTRPIGDYHGWPLATSWLQPSVLSSLAILFLVILVMAAISWRSKIFAAGVCFTLLAFAPVANIIPMYQVMAERFMYFPMMGAALSFSIILSWLFRRNMQFVWLPVAIVILLGATAISWQRAWVDNETFQKTNVEVMPTNPRAKFNVAFILRKEGETTRALEMLLENLTHYPRHLESAMMVATILDQQYGETSATGYLLKIRDNFPKAASPPGYLGDLAFRRGELEQAVRYYDEAVSKEARIVPLWYWRGVAHYQVGNRNEAEKSFREALKLEPGFTSATRALEELRESE